MSRHGSDRVVSLWIELEGDDEFVEPDDRRLCHRGRRRSVRDPHLLIQSEFVLERPSWLIVTIPLVSTPFRCGFGDLIMDHGGIRCIHMHECGLS